MTIKLIGQRITLRPPKISDAQDICEGVQHPSVPRNTFVPSPYHIEDALSFIKRTRKNHKAGTTCTLAIIENKSHKLVGMVGVERISLRHKRGELGYWLNLNYRNNGYMSEAVSLILKHCFKTLKLEKIEAGTKTSNDISIRLLLKVGFKQEGLIRRHMKHRGRWIDLYRYGLLKSEYAGRGGK
jgi:RimJ/RimL family protein N-acetyltransferase